MKLSAVSIRNFRRLETVAIDIEDKETIFVGPNNSGKTSATAVFRSFLGETVRASDEDLGFLKGRGLLGRAAQIMSRAG